MTDRLSEIEARLDRHLNENPDPDEWLAEEWADIRWLADEVRRLQRVLDEIDGIETGWKEYKASKGTVYDRLRKYEVLEAAVRRLKESRFVLASLDMLAALRELDGPKEKGD